MLRSLLFFAAKTFKFSKFKVFVGRPIDFFQRNRRIFWHIWHVSEDPKTIIYYQFTFGINVLWDKYRLYMAFTKRLNLFFYNAIESKNSFLKIIFYLRSWFLTTVSFKLVRFWPAGFCKFLSYSIWCIKLKVMFQVLMRLTLKDVKIKLRFKNKLNSF